ncbi:MAG: hypothetical protein LBP78_00370 [Acidaminococcales bacterium]|nr:hypothetical protein [Acidaminococcales bacterium]
MNSSSIIIYRLFDIADEIDLDHVQALWAARNKIASRLRLERVSPKAIAFKDPPVSVELGSHEIMLGGRPHLAEIRARIYDIGVISIIVRIDLPEQATYDDFLDLAIASENIPEDKIHELVKSVADTIKQALIKPREPEFEEDLVVYYLYEWKKDWDIVQLLLKDRIPASKQTREETLANCLSYAEDVAYFTWDAALVYDPSGSMDIPDLLEFANAQFLELRYYDNLLEKEIGTMYTELEKITSISDRQRLRNYRRIRGQLMELVADVASLTDRINNSLRVTEDVFYARVYSLYIRLLRADSWRQSIDSNISVIQRTYNMLNEEVITRRSEFLDTAVVALLGLIALLNIYAIFLR